MVTEVGCSVSVPVLSLLFSDSLIAVTFRATSEPAGITTCPELSFTSLAILAITVSPTLFLLERISAVVAAVTLVPAARLAAEGVGVEGAGAGVAGFEAVAGELGELVVGRMGFAGVLGAGAGVEVLAVGRSFNSAVVSTGAS